MYDYTQNWNVEEMEEGRYPTKEEAYSEMIKKYAHVNCISLDVARVIFRKREKINRLTNEIHELRNESSIETDKETTLEALNYVSLIPKIEDESYRDTSTRLSDAIGKGVNKIAFHKAIKLIRTKSL